MKNLDTERIMTDASRLASNLPGRVTRATEAFHTTIVWLVETRVKKPCLPLKTELSYVDQLWCCEMTN